MLLPSVPIFYSAASAWMTRLKEGQNVVGLGHLTTQRTWQHHDYRRSRRAHYFHDRLVIEPEGTRIYFAGDTYVASFMMRIGRKMHPGVALIGVTTYRIPMTMGKSQAVQAVRLLSPHTVIPIHLGGRARHGCA